MASLARSLPSHQPDLRVLNVLGVFQYICLTSIAIVAGTVFCAWLIPGLQNLLPAEWGLMKANTALLTLICALSIVLDRPRRSARSGTAGRLLGAFVALVSAATLFEYFFTVSLHLDTLLNADAGTPMAGRMSFQTALSFFLLGLVLMDLRARKRMLSWLIDGLTLCLALMMLVFIAGYIYGALGLFGLSMLHRLPPQTLFCFVLLTFLAFNRRTEYGVFSIMIDGGIGGKTARLAAPCAVLLPFVLAAVRGLITRYQLVPEQYGIALAAALLALISFCFVVVLSTRCQVLESAIRELSIRDELTRLYNRRGFFLLAEQALHLAFREREIFFLIFIDVDNLKQTNDNLGHEAGSELLHAMAAILRETFRETDVIGRLGGDEFVVAGKGGHDEIAAAIARLEEAANAGNSLPSRKYAIDFSLGHVTAEGDTPESLEDLLHRADAIMYQAKRSKRRAYEPARKAEAHLVSGVLS